MWLLGRLAIFMLLVARRRYWDKKGHLFASHDFSTPILWHRLRMVLHVLWSLLDLPLDEFPPQKLEKIWPLAEGFWPQYKLGDPPKKEGLWMQGTLSLPKAGKRLSISLHSVPSWLSEFRAEGPCRMCLFVALLLPCLLVSLRFHGISVWIDLLSFQMLPLCTFISTWPLGKNSQPLVQVFSPVFKSLKDQKLD